MKRIIFGFGFIAAFFISTALWFRTMHWPGAMPLSLIGNTALIVSSIALLVNNTRRMKSQAPSDKVRAIVGFCAAFLVASGDIFKVFWLPGANIQFSLGVCLLSFVYAPMLFYYLYKQSLMKLS